MINFTPIENCSKANAKIFQTREIFVGIVIPEFSYPMWVAIGSFNFGEKNKPNILLIIPLMRRMSMKRDLIGL